ncbi:hypothetical protein SAMN05421759_104162 [Roseivivax lentus]|uniref:Uncharacterized protein n=1 Tax=Roseivivax lentus TaxID=633194 RepID=A0A1N7MBC4_9RHOB|nr:hypothetical protein [Roseivivax lentus]SIS83425.1 hypothetical protein SAMN05421759_104162 [Roseivivax lentus]
MTTSTSRTASKIDAAEALRALEDAFAYYPGNALHQRPSSKGRADTQAAQLARYA